MTLTLDSLASLSGLLSRNGRHYIDQPFTGNRLAVHLRINPNLDRANTIIGILTQHFGTHRHDYQIRASQTIVSLHLPETDFLSFFPFNSLYDEYGLDLAYTNVGDSMSEAVVYALPESIALLPDRVTDVEETLAIVGTDIVTLQGKVETLESATPSSDWEDITDKPSTFPPSTHGHEFSDITGLSETLGTQDLLILDLTDRVETLESSTSSGATINKSAETSLALDGTLTITGKEVLKVYKRVTLAGENLIPTMTSNTAPSPLVASVSGSADGQAFNVFDKNLTDRGWLADSQSSSYVQIDMGTAITADTLSVLVRTASIAALEYARKLTLVTSNDGSTWSSPKVAETNWIPTGGVFTDFFFTATTARYWRLFCEDRPSGYPAVNEMKLSLSTGYRYDDVTKDYTISRNEMDVTDTSVFTLTKKSTGTDAVIVTYL